MLTFVGAVTLAASIGQAQDPTPAAPVVSRVEPPLQLVLEAGGREHAVTLDQPLELEAPAGGKLPVVLRCRPWRELVLPSLTLRYPREYHFEFEEDEPVTIWTLTGANATLMLFHVPVSDGDSAAAAREYADGMKLGLGRATTEEAAPRLVLDGVELPGVRLRAKLGAAIVQDCHARATKGGGTTVLVLQHSTDDGGAEPPDSVALRKQIVDTLRWR